MSTNLIPVDQVDESTVNLIVVYNCLNMQDRELSKLVHDPRKSLADYMVGLPEPEKWSVSVNGELFDVEEWATIYPAKDDFITLMPIPYGGDKGKSILRIAAMVAIAVAAPYMIPAMGPVATAAAIAGINVAGAMVVNALLPMPKPSTPGYGDTSESTTYGVDGAKNTSTEQTSVPLIYGEFRYAGNIVNVKTENQDDAQLITAQMVVSEGSIESISGFEVQDQPIGNYQDVETVTRLGTDNQEIAGWFASAVRMVNKAATLSPTATTHKTTGEIDGFRVDVLFPGGLSEINKKDGKRFDRTVEFLIEYNREGTSSWNSFTGSVTAKTGQPLRRSFSSPTLTEGVYNIRVRRTTPESTEDLKVDRVTLTDIAEIIDERVRYNHTAFFGVRIRLSDQLSGMPRITAMVKGIKVNQYDFSGRVVRTAWSNNPAWITLDMLTNKRYGAGLSISRIDIRMFVEWAVFCQNNNLTFNGVFDSITNIWDACQIVLRVGHARFTSIGNIYSLTIYRATEPVMMFGSGSIIEGSLQLSWQSLEDRANEFEIEYFDRENGNKPAIVRVVNEKSLDRGEPQRVSTIRMVGIDNQPQALHEAYFQKALNEHLIMTGQFEATVESLACGVGDVVLIQHDMPDWGESGRIKPDSTRTLINVDRPLEILATPSDISFLILHPAVIRGTGVISNINAANKIIYLTGLATSIRGKRIKVGSKDLLVLSMSAAGGYLEVVVESVSGLSVGNAVELWDTDVIETRKVQSYNASKRQLQLAGPLSIDPQDFANYMVGKSNLAAKPVSITGISGTGEYKRTIKFIEYNHTVFDPENAQPTPIFSRPISPVQHVRDLRAIEEVTMRNGSLISDVVVSWSKPADGNYAGAQVYMSRNGGPLLRHGTAAAGATVYHTTAVFGEILVFKVVAYDGAGRVADFDTAPIFEFTVTKSGDLPPVVQNFRATLGMDGVELIWDLIDDPDVVGYEIREGVSWAAGRKLVSGLASNRFFSTEKNHSFTYWIKATDITGKQSAAASMATVVDLLKPGVPTSVDIETSSFVIKLMPNGLSPGAIWEFRRSNAPLANNQIASNSVKVGQGTYLVDSGLPHGTTYYYYIRGVNAFGVGDWYPVQAATKTDIPEILNALAGQIRESHLWGALNSRINLIDGPVALDGSVAKRIAAEQSQRSAALLAEANARIAAITKEQGDRAAAITTEANARKSADDAIVSNVTTLTAAVNKNAADVSSEQKARADADSALATDISTVLAKSNANSASIVNEAKARTDADTALTTQINSVLSKANANTAAITNESKARADADTALSSNVTAVSAKTDTNAAAIVTERNARTSAVSALSSQINTVQSSLGDAISTARVEAETSANGATIVKNGMFSTGDTTGWPGSWTGLSVAQKNDASSTSAERTMPTLYAALFPNSDHSSYRYLYGEYFPVTEGDEYVVRADYAGGGNDIGVNFRVYIQWRNDAVNTTTTNYFTTTATSTSWSRTAPRSYKVPAGATRARIYIRRELNGNGSLYVTNIVGYRSDDAMSSLITDVQTTLGSNIAGVQTSLNTNVSRLDGRVDTVASSVTTVASKTDTNTAAISSEATTRANADAALSSQITTAQSNLNGSISSVQQSLSTSISNVGKRVDGMADTTNLVSNGSFFTGDTTGWLNVSSAVDVISGVERGGSIAANYVMRFPSDEVSYTPRSTSVPVRSGEKFSVSFDFAHGNTSASNRFRSLVQWFNAAGATVATHYGVTQSATFSWQRYGPHVFTAPDNATSARFGIQRLNANSGVGYATNMVVSRVDEVLGAQYTLKLDVNGFVSGFGAYNDGVTSDFGVIANRFYIAAPGSTTGAMPFLVSGNSVYINEALIQTLTIGKLRSSTGGVVVTGNKISAEFIDADNLDVRSSARFSGDVQSASYSSAAKTGWRIRQNGTVEFNEGQFNGTLNVGSGTLGDSVTIAGVDSLGLIRQRAYAGSLSKDRTDQWTRPSSTLIDGNKIFTGDAYVDTLQIQGQAVTISVSSAAGSLLTLSPNQEAEIVSVWIDAQGANVLTMASLGVTSGSLANFEVRRNGVTVISRPGGNGALSFAGHVGAKTSGGDHYSVVVRANSITTTITGRSIGLTATRR